MSIKKENLKFYKTEWKIITKKKKTETNYKCQKCGKEHNTENTKNILTVHHIDSNPQNNTPENLIALCTVCHMREQGKLWRIEKYNLKYLTQLQLF